MLAGIILILAGILIALYPPLLSIIVAAVLITAGVLLVSVAHYHRKMRREFENPAVELFFRF